MSVWLGGLFSQEAYFTATRQSVAQCKGYSLEELKLQVSVHNAPVELDNSSFGISGLKLMGAMHSDGKLTITEDIMTDLVYTKISWVRDQDIQISGKQITLPVYLNNTRTTLVETLNFRTDQDKFYERGVAILCTGLS
ncbi:cytoplasmic dynein 1 heavy chain 1-like isoform X1 [Bolinopsis microptera]